MSNDLPRPVLQIRIDHLTRRLDRLERVVEADRRLMTVARQAALAENVAEDEPAMKPADAGEWWIAIPNPGDARAIARIQEAAHARTGDGVAIQTWIAAILDVLRSGEWRKPTEDKP